MKSISFSDEMVRAIIDGRKTQTRRIVKPQPLRYRGDTFRFPNAPDKFCFDVAVSIGEITSAISCPVGKVGDIIYVKEKPDIKLEITNIRVERVQDISEEDAKAEGATSAEFDDEGTHTGLSYRTGFKILWNSIYGEGEWNLNPFVWCISFKRVTPCGEGI